MHLKFAVIALLALILTACGLDLPDRENAPARQEPDSVQPLTIPDAQPTPVDSAATPPPVVAQPIAPRGPDPRPVPAYNFSEACLERALGQDEEEADDNVRLVAPGGVKTPEAYVPIPLLRDRNLERTLTGVLGGDAARYAYVIKDLSTGAGAAHNAERVFSAASLFKLFVMHEVFHQQSQGFFEWDDELVVTPYYDSFGLMALRHTGLCQVVTVTEALEAMMSISDNAAAVLLQDFVGAPNVNRTLEALGIRDSGLFPEGLPITVADVALLLEAVALGEAVSAEASAEMLRLMLSEGIDNGLVAGLPAGVKAAHKTGNWANATHDAGIVYTDGGAYLFVVLSETTHETAVIEALSRAAYEAFAGE